MGQSVQMWLDVSQSEKMLGSETKAPPSVPLLLSLPRQFVHPSIADPSMDAEEGLGAELSGFQGGVSGPPAPQAGKLRLRKEPSRPLPQTTTYSTTSTSPQQSKAMSRLENLNQWRELTLFHYRGDIYLGGWNIEEYRFAFYLWCGSSEWVALTFFFINRRHSNFSPSLTLCPCPVYPTIRFNIRSKAFSIFQSKQGRPGVTI